MSPEHSPTTSDGLNQRVDQALGAHLRHELGREGLFRVAARALGSVIPFDRIGIARIHRPNKDFEVVALHAHDAPKDGLVGSRFCYRETIGEWVHKNGLPVAAETTEQIRAYPETLEYCERESFESVLVLPLDTSPTDGRVLYAVCREARRIQRQEVPRYLKAVGRVFPVLQLCSQVTDADMPLEQPTLDDVQRMHINKVLSETRGVIEGPRGAAAILGLAPSTLRNRMRKLGISRMAGPNGRRNAAEL